ncbi:hypothetical protein HHI36_018196, partial [Cryptolaemus montrouzieri]
DSRMKMKVKVAAAQLSYSVAACIETWVASGNLPSEAVHTAEFVHKVDSLFDSLNGYSFSVPEGKPLKGVLKRDSPHIEYWSKMLLELRNWKLIDKRNNKDVTNQFHFIKGWQITIRSIIYLWHRLQKVGFKYFSLRSFNQDPLENLFCIIRQHGVGNTNPTCHQFIAALKTSVINGLTSPIINGNCKKDDCENLNDLSFFLQTNSQNILTDSADSEPSVPEEYNEIFGNLPTPITDNYATYYVAGYLLRKITVPECHVCKEELFCEVPQQQHTFITFKEFCDNKSKLTYPSVKVSQFLEDIHNRLYFFLNSQGHQENLALRFKDIYKSHFSQFDFCQLHSVKDEIFERATRLLIFKFIKDKKKETVTSGTESKSKRFRNK